MPTHMPVEEFFAEIEDPKHSENYKMDTIFSYINNLLVKGEFEFCNNLFSQNFTKLSTTLLLAFLTITLAAKDKLEDRSVFYWLVEELLIYKYNDQDKVNRLLDGLE